ncbi:hypothetical protein PILCRDRAFT_10422 [Piloderma croceum F 1598]|uniref:Uncharacterized protein n=1 Tax=Piloderma croceum (strain F 1598) TaxID=765440 RepID=A0A0C3BPP0_PILCF|nr:hypothetical protein PILCRDRAFT_90177 [Piloderma croceum F 1598]KIM79272.1 hypothetical protein PILCRDRAFT_10422 [Piloderma croceum F 1598]
MQGVTNNSDGISVGRLAALPQPQQFTPVVDAGHVETRTNGVAITGPSYRTGPEIAVHDILHFSNEGTVILRDAVFQYPAFTNEDLDMPLPDNLGQILSRAMATEPGSQFTAHSCLCSETYRCDMHDLGEPFYTV